MLSTVSGDARVTSAHNCTGDARKNGNSGMRHHRCGHFDLHPLTVDRNGNYEDRQRQAQRASYFRWRTNSTSSICTWKCLQLYWADALLLET
eukprot:12424321-Karenia_brevis.AAC.1